MKISTLLKAIAAGLQTLAAPSHGKVDATAGADESFGLLALGAQSWRIILHWAGDDVEPAQPWQGECRISVIVQQVTGMQATSGRDLTESVSGRLPFYDLLDQVRCWLLGFEYKDANGAANHPAIDWSSFSGICLAARPLILEGKDGQIISGVRQAEFEYLIRRAWPSLTRTAISIPND